MKKIYQCCYTNATHIENGTAKSGWQPVAVSPDIPRAALSRCVNFQISASDIRKPMTDENGSDLNLFEVRSDGGFIYMIRTQYGLYNTQGRANMFSHALIFDSADKSFFRNPRDFLAFSDENFRRTEEEAQAAEGRYIKGETLNIKKAMDIVGLDGDKYSVFAGCVWLRSGGRKSAPLFVNWDGSAEQLRRLVFLIFYALPFGMREKLNISTDGSADYTGRNIVISRRAKERPYWLLPESGDNNYIDRRNEILIERYGFVDWVAKKSPDIDAASYFLSLDEIAENIKKGGRGNSLVLKAAHSISMEPDVEKTDDRQLAERISDILSVGVEGSDFAGGYLASMLGTALRRGLFINEYDIENLLRLTVDTHNPKLRRQGGLYLTGRISQNGDENAVDALYKMENNEWFAEFCRILKENTKGINILDLYFKRKIYDLRDMTSERILQFVIRRRGMAGFPQSAGAAAAAAADIFLENPTEDNFLSACKISESVFDGEAAENAVRDIRKKYWETMSYEKFNPDDRELYTDAADESVISESFVELAGICSRGYDSEEEFVLQSGEYFSKYFPCTDADLSCVGILEKKGEEMFPGPDSAIKSRIFISSRPVGEKVREIQKAILAGETETARAELEKLCGGDPLSGDEKSAVADILLRRCRLSFGKNREEHADLYLLAGRLVFDNPFRVFSLCNNGEFRDLKKAFSSSRLMKTEEYISMANEYDGDGRTAKKLRRMAAGGKPGLNILGFFGKAKRETGEDK